MELISFSTNFKLSNFISKQERSLGSRFIDSVKLPESIIKSAIGIYEIKEVYKDSNGLVLVNGNTVVLSQILNVKGANFMAPKGTIIKKIKLVPDNILQIEDKINNQIIFILTQFVKKASRLLCY